MARQGSAVRGELEFPDRSLAGALQRLPDAVVLVDAASRLLWGNRAAERLFGISIDEAVGASGLDLVHPDDAELALVSLASVQHKEVGSAIEVRVRTPAGWRLVEVVGAPLPEAEPGTLLLSLRDLTQRRRWEVAGDEVAKFRSLVHHSAAITILLSPTGAIEGASGALTRALGHDPEAIVGRNLTELVDDDDRPALADALDRASQEPVGNGPVTVEVRLRRAHDPGSVPFHLAIVNLLEDPTVRGFVVSAHDITGRLAVEAELRETLSLLNATLDASADGILVVDSHGRITSFNRRIAEMWQLPTEVLESRDGNRAIEAVRDQLVDPEGFAASIMALRADTESESHDRVEFLDGRVFERDSKPQRVGNTVVGRVWSYRDVTERRRLEKELAHQAFHDSLTGLANQALFRERVEHALERRPRYGGHFAVLFVDVDNFKNINDSLGHPAGDRLLVEVTERLRANLRASDTAARLGGDEFAILLEDIPDAGAAVDVADRIIVSLRAPFDIGTKEVFASASIGIALHHEGVTGDDLLRNADLAMYTAKAAGKARYELFEPHMHDAALERLELEADLRRAVLRGELVVHYQPIVSLGTGQIVGAEALLRWQHPTRGLLGPSTFIPLAEDAGIIDDIGEHVLDEACDRALAWQARMPEGRPFTINVNLSPHQLLDALVVDRVADVLARTGLQPADLTLEITEGAMVSDTETAVRRMHDLKRLGVRLAVDDFGTGHSSLNSLRRFPVDILKIDRSFVNGIDQGPEESALARAVLRLAQTLGLTAIAEGVESADQARRLREIGCDLAQGFHLGTPVPREVFEELVDQQARRVT